MRSAIKAGIFHIHCGYSKARSPNELHNNLHFMQMILFLIIKVGNRQWLFMLINWLDWWVKWEIAINVDKSAAELIQGSWR